MSVNNADYQITISTPADLEGANATIAALEKSIERAKLLGNNYDTLAAKLEHLKTATAAYAAQTPGADAEANAEIKKTLDAATGKSLEGVGQKAGEASEKLHGLHAIIRTVGTQFPGLERFSRFLESGFTMALGVVAIAAEFLHEKIKALAEVSLMDLGQGSQQAQERVDKLREAMDASATSSVVWREEIARTIEAEQTLKDKTDELIARQKALADVQDEVAKANDDLRSAQIDLAEKLGAITKPQAIKMKLELDETEFKEKLQAEQAGIQAQIDARKNQQAQAQQTVEYMGHPGGPLETRKKAADEAQAAKVAHDAKLKSEQTDLEDAKKRRDEAAKLVEDLTAEQQMWGYGKYDPHSHQLRDAQQNLAQANSNVQSLSKGVEGGKASQGAVDTAAETAKADFEAVKTKFADAAKEAHDLGFELEKLTGDLAAAKAKAAALIPAHNAAAEARAAVAMADTPEGRAAADTGVAASADAIAALNAARSLAQRAASGTEASGDAAALRELLGIMQALHNNHASSLNGFRAQIDAMTTDLTNLQNQMANNGSLH